VLTSARFRHLQVKPPHLLRLMLLIVGLFVAGCATSGPNHLYATAAADGTVHDLGPGPKNLPQLVAPGERVLGLAYDFNTDHLFLRIAPSQVIRVVERPSGKILREMPLPPELRTENSADLAIRAGDRHLFAAHPDDRSVVELTLLGVPVRRIALAGFTAGIGGLAYDQKNDRLLLVTHTGRIGSVGPGGNVNYWMTLPATARPVSLAYDSEAQHFFVPLVDGNSVGEFDVAGKQVGTRATGPVTALDAGPRSFVRVF
jgi:hypothetical protein